MRRARHADGKDWATRSLGEIDGSRLHLLGRAFGTVRRVRHHPTLLQLAVELQQSTRPASAARTTDGIEAAAAEKPVLQIAIIGERDQRVETHMAAVVDRQNRHTVPGQHQAALALIADPGQLLPSDHSEPDGGGDARRYQPEQPEDGAALQPILKRTEPRHWPPPAI